MGSALEDEFFEMFSNGNRIEKREQACELLARLKQYHLPTYEHSLRVGLTSAQINRVMHLSPEAGLWAALHDIGKLGIQLELLDKTGGFNEADMREMRQHVIYGYQILRDKGLRFSSWIALTHHRFQQNHYPTDGEIAEIGFPLPGALPETRLTADEVARMTSLADTYDASHRPNNRFRGKLLTGREIRENMARDNPSRLDLIQELYWQGIFHE